MPKTKTKESKHPLSSVNDGSHNCEAGDLWTEGKHYLFDGPETDNENFRGYVGVKDATTGKRLGLSDTERGKELGSLWLTMCPMGWPYKTVPLVVELPDSLSVVSKHLPECRHG